MVRAASTAAYAAKLTWMQSRAARQNRALGARIEMGMYNSANVLGRLQYAQAGEKAYVHRAIMRTVDTAQATAYERQLWNKITTISKKASKSTYKTPRNPTAASKAAAAAGRAAGLKAASAPALVKSARAAKAKAKSARSAKASATAKATAKATAAKRKSSQARAAQSKKAPAAKAKARTAPMMPGQYASLQGRTQPPARKWMGNETEPQCIAFAVANHLLQAKDVIVGDSDIAELTEAAGPGASIEDTLWAAYMTGWPRDKPIHLGDYKLIEDLRSMQALRALVIGYEVPGDDGPAGHAALSLPTGHVVTWGRKIQLDPEVEEAWELRWDA